MCLAQGHKAVMTVRLKSASPPTRVKHSTTELPTFLYQVYKAWHRKCLLKRNALPRLANLIYKGSKPGFLINQLPLPNWEWGVSVVECLT